MNFGVKLTKQFGELKNTLVLLILIDPQYAYYNGSDSAAFLTEKHDPAFPIQLNPTIHLSKPRISFISHFLYTNLKARERLRYSTAGSCFSFSIVADLFPIIGTE